MRTASLELRRERAGPSDPALDFCLWRYRRPRAPTADALRTSALLYRSFAVAGADTMPAVADALRRGLGRFATVFGVKWADGRLIWEFYLYDYARWQRRRGARELAAALAGLVELRVTPRDDVPYFMVSVEIGAEHVAGGAPIEQLDLYMGLPDSHVSAGACYGHTREGLALRNLYHFFDAATARRDAIDRAFASVRFDGRRIDPAHLFWPEMAGAATLVVANKRWYDGLYFSRVDVDALLHFLRRAGFPGPLVAFAERNRDALGHHLFDVGYDHAIDAQGRPRIVKGSFYGLL